MQVILDHLSAVIISSAVLLLILSTQFNAQRATTEQTIASIAKKSTLEMVDYLEDELLLIGDGTEDTIQSASTNSDGMTTAFSFWRQDDSGTDMLVSYTLTEQDSVQFKDDWVQLYQFNRSENGVASGGGSSTLSHFEITMLTETGAVTTTPANARLLRLRAVTVYPYGDPDDSYLHRTFWGITLRPMNLGV
ncbi:hypothetical protein HQ496_00685 [bacterium]|nr:hypothetical protein [bacterium]